MEEINGHISKGIDIYPLPQNDDNLDIDDYMNLLSNYLKDIINSKYSESNQKLDFEIYNLSEELRKLNKYNCKILMNKQQNVIRIDGFERYPGHQLNLSIKSNDNIQIISHTIPDCIFNNKNNDFFRHTSTIENFLTQFLQILEMLEEFYDNLNTIDELCNVVEPANITLKDNWRIFKLNEKIFMKITIDPLTPTSVDVNLIGPTNEVEKYREMYNEKVKNWDIDLNIHQNLLRIFDLMYFPMNNKSNTNEDEDEENYCNICYMYRLGNHIPIISCDNSKCPLIFHAYCLKHWFSTLLDEKKFLNVNMGKCPFCKEVMLLKNCFQISK